MHSYIALLQALLVYHETISDTTQCFVPPSPTVFTFLLRILSVNKAKDSHTLTEIPNKMWFNNGITRTTIKLTKKSLHSQL